MKMFNWMSICIFPIENIFKKHKNGEKIKIASLSYKNAKKEKRIFNHIKLNFYYLTIRLSCTEKVWGLVILRWKWYDIDTYYVEKMKISDVKKIEILVESFMLSVDFFLLSVFCIFGIKNVQSNLYTFSRSQVIF